MSTAGRRWDIGLTLVSALLASTLAYEIWAPLGDFDPPAVAVPDQPPPPATIPFNPPPQATFAAIDARPIFNPTRKPVEATAVAGNSTAAAPPDVVLVGVIIDPKNQLALVKREGAPFAESLALGASLDGWEVTEIAADHVTLRSAAQEFVLGLDGKRKSQPNQPGSAMAPPGGAAGPTMPTPFAGTRTRPKAPATETPPAPTDGDDDQQQKAMTGAQ